MRVRCVILIILSLISGCVVIPKETTILSEKLGEDLQILHDSHKNLVEIYYGKIKEDINLFVDDIYAPYVIHYALKDQFERYKKGDSSLFKVIEVAASKQGKQESENALNEMVDFQKAAFWQIDQKRNELLLPITTQESDIINQIDKAYENTIYANSTITGYLKSIRKVKESQQEAISYIGLQGADTIVTNSLIRLSKLVKQAIEEGKEVDIKSDDAYKQLESITNRIKRSINKL